MARGKLPALLAGPAHREEELGPQRGALRQVAGLGQQLPRAVGIGRDRPDPRARAAAGRRRDRPRPAGPCGRRPGAARPRSGPAPRRRPGCPRPARCPPARTGSWGPRGPWDSPPGRPEASPGPRPSALPVVRRWPEDTPGRPAHRGPWQPVQGCERTPCRIVLALLQGGNDLAGYDGRGRADRRSSGDRRRRGDGRIRPVAASLERAAANVASKKTPRPTDSGVTTRASRSSGRRGSMLLGLDETRRMHDPTRHDSGKDAGGRRRKRTLGVGCSACVSGSQVPVLPPVVQRVPKDSRKQAPFLSAFSLDGR